MARFNNSVAQSNKTVNLAGGEAFKETKKWEFASMMLTSLLTDQFYRSGQKSLMNMQNLIGEIPDKKFVAKTAIYARNVFGMRTASHVVAGELAGVVRGQSWVKNFIHKVVRRPDDMTEITGYYLARFGRPNFAPQLKKGLASSFSKFDKYQLAKYRSDGKEVSLVDIVNLVHPKPVESNEEALRELVKGTLRNTETAQARLSVAGQVKEEEDVANLKTEVWIDMLRTRKIAYFELLKNLRNILEQAPSVIQDACEMLVDEGLIRKSLVFPYRFWTAYKAIAECHNDTNTRKILMAIGDALEISLKNVPVFEGETAVVLDTSSSMRGQPAEIGSIFASVLAKSNNADLIVFDRDTRYMRYDAGMRVIDLTSHLLSTFNGGATNFVSIFPAMTKRYERVFILSDMQGWVSHKTPTTEFSNYRKRFNCSPTVYSFDLRGYGTLQFPENSVYCLAGYSDKLFDIIPDLELDRNALIHKIEDIQL